MTPILVGLRLGEEYRNRNWAYARSRWEATLPDWPIFEGHYDDPGPFSLARASNRAAALAGYWEVALYVGADFLIKDVTQAYSAVEKARRTGQLIFAHNYQLMLSEIETIDLIGAGPTATPVSEQTQASNTFSGVLAIPRSLWDTVGGFDERFVDWGYDDLAFWSACSAMAGGFERVQGGLYHLWHPRSRAENEENPNFAANQVLGNRYLDAKFNKREMVKILAERAA